MRKHIYIFISFVLLLQVVSNEGFSQSLMGKDLKTINIDDLTDEEILSYMRQVESSGYTEQQLEALARQRGMSESQIAKLRRRVEDLRNSL
ncbi:hypothetical protein, partial [uncultured Roseivirga sp.]